jgi:peptidoglycan glycosyltransferase
LPRWIRIVALFASAALLAYGLWAQDGISDARWLACLGLSWVCLLIGLWMPLPSELNAERRTVVRTGVLFAASFVAVSMQLLRMQVTNRESLAQRVGVSPDGETLGNPRRVALGLAVKRGEIMAADGTPLATTEPITLGWGRGYPEPSVFGIIGYYSPLQYGTAGIELAFDEELTGEESGSPLIELRDDLLHRPREGSNVVLTVEPDLQRLADESFGDRYGAAVVVEVATGRVLAMTNRPAIDPRALFAENYDETAVAAEYWQSVINDPATPLVPRSTLGLYTPGSIFKVITAAAALDAGITSPDDIYIDDGQLEISGRIIVENNRPDDSVIEWTLADSLAWSLNVVYAQVGLEVGAERMREYAHRFGFDEAIPFEIPVARSQLERLDGFLNAPVALAETAFGQGQLQVTPLHMALVAAGIANGGTLMVPTMLDRIVAPDGTVVRTAKQTVWREAIGAEAASDVQDMMIHAVETGYAAAAYVPGLRLGGKTGTAGVPDGEPHAWFIGFAGTWNDDTPRHAVAVVVEHGGGGRAGAMDIGRELLAAAANRDAN